MFHKIKRFLGRLTGSHKTDIDHRVFLFTSIALTIFAFQAGIFNYFLELHYMTVVLSFVGGVASLFVYSFSIRQEQLNKKNYTWYAIFIFTILFPMYFYNGGSYGTILYLIVALLNALMIIGRLRQIVTIFLVLLGVILLMLGLELYFPHMVVAYTSESQRMSDLVTVMLYSVSFTTYIIWMFKRKHFQDREQIIRQKSELEYAYGEIIRKNEKIETLMLEMHHRVKNNLQLASSLLSLQMNRVDPADPQKAIQESKNRLDVIALLHQQLSFREDETTINIRDFLAQICRSICLACELGDQAIQLDGKLENEMLDFEKANSMGLIVNELITNSLKYARPAYDPLQIRVELNNTDQGLLLEYSDNGCEKIIRDESLSGNLGTKLIATLVKQLNATQSLNQKEGRNNFIFEIPL